MCYVQDDHGTIGVIDVVEDPVVSDANAKTLPARELSALRWPWIAGQRLNAVEDAAADVGWKTLELPDGSRQDRERVSQESLRSISARAWSKGMGASPEAFAAS